MKPDDAEAAVRRIVADQVAAWNARDGVAYARPFAVDGSFTNVYGQRYVGHAAFEQRHVDILATFFRGSVLTAAIREIRIVGPDAAVAEVDTEVRGAGAMPPGAGPGPDGVLRTRLLQVFVRRGGEWKIVVHHNVAVSVR